MSMRVKVFNIKTGESVEVAGVDAREYVKSGGWSLNPPEKTVKKQRPSKKVDKIEVDKEVIKKAAKK